VIAAWNLVAPDQQGAGKLVHLRFGHIDKHAEVSIQYADSQHGNTLGAYQALGNPRYPTQAQVALINRTAQIPPAERVRLKDGSFDLNLSPNGLALIEVSLAKKK
jgi:xylan 1,4-beta-xylosidase